MKRLIINEDVIRRIVDEVSPLVEEIIPWTIAHDSMSIEALQKNRGYEEILLGRIRGAGVEIDDTERRSLVERLIEYVIEDVVLAAYEPSLCRLYVVRENVDDSNPDGLRLIIAHELVHRAQHLRYPELFSRVDYIIRDIFYLLSDGGSLKDAMARIRDIEPIMTLLESHAFYVQEKLRYTKFPGAKIEKHFNLPTLLMRVFGRRKIKQYHKGIPLLIRNQVMGNVDSLYQQILLGK